MYNCFLRTTALLTAPGFLLIIRYIASNPIRKAMPTRNTSSLNSPSKSGASAGHAWLSARHCCSQMTAVAEALRKMTAWVYCSQPCDMCMWEGGRCGSMSGGGQETWPDLPAAGSGCLISRFGDPAFITPVRMLSTLTFSVAGLWILCAQTSRVTGLWSSSTQTFGV